MPKPIPFHKLSRTIFTNYQLLTTNYSPMTKVMIGPSHLAKEKGAFFDVLQTSNAEFIYPKKNVQMTESDILEQFHDVEAAIAGSEPYTRKVFETFPKLRILSRVGVGYDAVDVKAATEHGVVVTFAPGTNQNAVAEHCFSLILGLAKNVISQHNQIREGKWPRHANLPLRGKTLGLVGLGRIGKAMTRKAKAFDMPVIAYDPFPDTRFAQEQGIPLLTLEEVLKQADYVSLHLPFTPETAKLINAEKLGLMKPTAFLLNTARGAVVDEDALYDFLKNKKIAGAGLDVFEHEPPKGSPLLTLDNVVLTAHTAGVDVESRDAMALSAAKSLVALLKGEWPTEQIVNPEVKDAFFARV